MATLRTALLSLVTIAFLGACGSEEVPVAQGRTMGTPPPAASDTAVDTPLARAMAEPTWDATDTDEAAADRLNQAPVIVGVVIEPFGEVTVRHDIVAKPQANDINDDEIEFRYSWRVNGARAFVDGGTLPKSKYRRGDWIDLTVVATDGTAASEPLASKPFEVTNAAPVITSTPGGFDESGVLHYQIEVEDPDDPEGFQYRLLDGPEGMQVDAEQGLLTWQPTKDQTGAHSARIEVVDTKGGKAWQTFDFEMDLVSGVTPAAPAPN
jgi:hypothetical protein